MLSTCITLHKKLHVVLVGGLCLKQGLVQTSRQQCIRITGELDLFCLKYSHPFLFLFCVNSLTRLIFRLELPADPLGEEAARLGFRFSL